MSFLMYHILSLFVLGFDRDHPVQKSVVSKRRRLLARKKAQLLGVGSDKRQAKRKNRMLAVAKVAGKSSSVFRPHQTPTNWRLQNSPPRFWEDLTLESLIYEA